MGNLVRKRTQILLNTVAADSITYGSGDPLEIKDYNQILVTDRILKFKKSSTATGTAQVDTCALAIVYPSAPEEGLEVYVTIKGKENLGVLNGPGRISNFFLGGVTFQFHIPLGAENAGMVSDANLQAAINGLVAQINGHEFFGDLITASRTNQSLVLTSKDARFQFITALESKFGTLTHTTPGVYPSLLLEDIQRIFPITKYKTGTDGSAIPNPTVTDWSRYYFRIEKDPAYSLDGANHLDKYVEEVEFYIPTAEAEGNHTTEGAWWDEKIFNHLTDISYSDPHGDTTPWGLVEGATP